MTAQNIRPYNLDNLALGFNSRLDMSTKVSRATKRSYRSDVLHFINWLKANRQQKIGPFSFNEYVSFLSADGTPIKSFNRRLSSLRLFCDYCLSEGFIETNYARAIANIKSLSNKKEFLFENCPLNNDELKDVEEFLAIVNG